MAETAKHTPGPWYRDVQDEVRCTTDDSPLFSAFLSKNPKADANLAAAAPDLLVALKASTEKLRTLLFAGDDHPLVAASIAAIAKAEGRS